MPKLVYVFSSPTCAPCKSLKDDLNKNNITYHEMKIDEGDNKHLAMVARIYSLPTTVISCEPFFQNNGKSIIYMPGKINTTITGYCDKTVDQIKKHLV
jgi:thioredoxin-related protein